jgi:hypothetical protein
MARSCGDVLCSMSVDEDERVRCGMLCIATGWLPDPDPAPVPLLLASDESLEYPSLTNRRFGGLKISSSSSP